MGLSQILRMFIWLEPESKPFKRCGEKQEIPPID